MALVPDRAWLNLASPEWAARISERWARHGRPSFETPQSLAEATLRRAAKSNPRRFVRLALRLPQDAPDFWFEAIIDAASSVEPDEDLAATDWEAASALEIEECLARIPGTINRELAMKISWLVGGRPTESWTDQTISLICTWATGHEDPPLEQATESAGSDDELDFHGVITQSINCARGVAIWAIARILWEQPNRREQFLRVAQAAVRDPHPAVRAASIDFVGPLLNDEPDCALALLETACASDRRILGSHELEALLRHLWSRPERRVEGIVERMTTSGLATIEERGAYFATVIAVLESRLTEVAARCAGGNVNQRKGAATALAQLVGPTHEAVVDPNRLSTFFDDEDPAVASAAAKVFDRGEVMRSPLGPMLASQFVASRQFARDPDDLVTGLEDFTGDLLPFQVVLSQIVDRATTDTSGLNGGIPRGGFRFADRTAECILRVYERAAGTGDVKIRSWCLDQIDALIASGNQYGEQILARIDSDA